MYRSADEPLVGRLVEQVDVVGEVPALVGREHVVELVVEDRVAFAQVHVGPNQPRAAANDEGVEHLELKIGADGELGAVAQVLGLRAGHAVEPAAETGELVVGVTAARRGERLEHVEGAEVLHERVRRPEAEHRHRLHLDVRAGPEELRADDGRQADTDEVVAQRERVALVQTQPVREAAFVQKSERVVAKGKRVAMHDAMQRWSLVLEGLSRSRSRAEERGEHGEASTKRAC